LSSGVDCVVLEVLVVFGVEKIICEVSADGQVSVGDVAVVFGLALFGLEPLEAALVVLLLRTG